MKRKKFLIFDFGASNCRAAVASFDGSKFTMETTHRFENRPVYAAGTLYWDILSLFQELKNGIYISLKKHPEIISMGIDTWGADFATIDKNGKLISNPVHYRDQQRARDSKSLFNIIPAKNIYNMTGAWIMPNFDIFHLYSLKINDSFELKNAKVFLPIADLFNYFLTGKIFNEITRLTTSAFYDQVNNKFAEEIFGKLGFPEDIFPQIIYPGQNIDKLSKNICNELSIKPLMVTAPATHDTASAAAGVPVKNHGEKWAYLSVGTWCSIGIETSKPVINEESFRADYMNEAGVEKTNIFGKNFNGLWTIQQCMKKWKTHKGGHFSWKDIDKLYPEAPAFKSILDIEHEAFTKPQANMPDVINNYCIKNGQKTLENIGEISRSIYESMVLKTKFYFEKLQELSGTYIKLFNLIGGGSNNKLFCQWMSDALGLPVIAGPAETTSIGNLLMQLKAEGLIEDIIQGRVISYNSASIINYEPKNTKAWEEAYGKFLRYFTMPI